MDKIKVLFVCIHNSARSQIAEALLNRLGKDKFFAESAGLEPGILNPLAVKTMAEIGIDISENKTKSVFDFLKQGENFDYIITVCDETSGERCPLFPDKKTVRLHWEFNDPSAFTGTEDEKLGMIRELRKKIKEKIEELISNV